MTEDDFAISVFTFSSCCRSAAMFLSVFSSAGSSDAADASVGFPVDVFELGAFFFLPEWVFEESSPPEGFTPPFPGAPLLPPRWLRRLRPSIILQVDEVRAFLDYV